MMKKIYENPSISIATFSVENIVTDLSGKTAQEIVQGQLGTTTQTFTANWGEMQTASDVIAIN